MKEEYPKAYFYRRIVMAKMFIDEHFKDEIDLNQIADTGHYSKFHFLREFKKIYGKSPKNYLKNLRIEKAMEYLKSRNTITDACYNVGYSSVQTFSNNFKKIVGKTPSQFKKDHLEREKLINEQPYNYIPNCAVHKTKKKNSNFE